VKFEYDPEKSKTNKTKHGIDFEEAKVLWNDPAALILQVMTEPEERFMLIAERSGKIWSAIFTYRSGGTRIISVRKSRDEEKQLYG
jgi:uncharacterized DUF497 family protein